MIVEEHKVPETQNPQGDYCVTLRIPANSEFVALLVGALSVLQEESYYERDADFSNNGALAVSEQWRIRTISPLISELLIATLCE